METVDHGKGQWSHFFYSQPIVDLPSNANYHYVVSQKKSLTLEMFLTAIKSIENVPSLFKYPLETGWWMALGKCSFNLFNWKALVYVFVW